MFPSLAMQETWEVAYCQIDTELSGKYDITREDYESKCKITIYIPEYADFPRLLRKSFYHSEHVRSFFLEQVQEAQRLYS